jgi:hypothetical protein
MEGMEQKDIWKRLKPDQKDKVAAKLETTKNYLSQVIHGHINGGKLLKKVLAKELDRLGSRL